MKIFKTVITTVVTAALIFSPVLAAEHVDSPTKGDGPAVVAATDSNGNDIAQNIVSTRMGTTSEVDKVNDYLAGAKADIEAAANKPANLKGADGATLEADLQKALDANGTTTKSADLTFAEVFDATYVDENGVAQDLTGPITITFDYNVPDGNVLIVMHNPVTGAWEVVDSSKVKVENGKVTVTLDSLSPIAFLTSPVVKAVETAVNNSKVDTAVKSAQTGEYVAVYVVIIAAALAVAGVVCVKRAKTSAK